MSTVRTITLCGLLAAVGCSPDYQTVRLSARSNPPVAVDIRGDRIELPAGIAVVLHAELLSKNDQDFPGNGELELYTTDASVFEVYPRPSDEEFLVVGIAPGHACMDVVVDGRLEDCIDVSVSTPPL